MIDQEIIRFANHLADLASEITAKYFRQHFGEENKDNDTPVTLADREIETAIREAITKKFPTHGIVGEEFGNSNENADYKWIIDPIDGTISFVIGRPIFGNLIALSHKNKPILGIINQAITKERWLGVVDGESKLNDHIIKSRNRDNISDAILCTTSPAFFKGKDLEIFEAIASQTKYQSQGGAIYGGDCYLFGLLAMGSIDIIIERGLKNYDFMALAPIVNSSGGIITDWDGNELNLNSDGKVLACGDKKIHQEILKLIKKF
jgi:inositol-phosphate phosphatase/L-galactose 1-phosphate phosphatase/histidinol-phosphatase